MFFSYINVYMNIYWRKARIISFSFSFQKRDMLTGNEEITQVISNSDILDRLGRAGTEKN